MFWMKSKVKAPEEGSAAERAAVEAEGHFRSGKLHCAEAVLLTIRNNFCPNVPEEVVQLASGFGGGSGSGCICGAVSGGTMALGMVLKQDKKKVTLLTKELHHWFKSQYGSTCCRVITTAGKKGCPMLTGAVAGKITEMLGS